MARAAQAARVLEASGACRLLRRRPWHGVVVMNYHRIGDGAGSPFDRNAFTTTAEAFDEQVAFAARNFDLITPGHLVEAARGGRGRHVMITFDDGYRDNYEVAMPILRSHGAPATFFVATGFVDVPRRPWWDEIAWMARTATAAVVPTGGWLAHDVPLRAGDRIGPITTLTDRYKTLPGDRAEAYLDYLAEATGAGRCGGGAGEWMTWDMVRGLRSAGMSVGAHTVTHPVLANHPAERQHDEIAGSKRRLEEELGEPVTAFSYPEGTPAAFDARTRAIVHALGFELAFSFYGGHRRFADWDPYDVRRATVSAATPLTLFQAMLTVPDLFTRPRTAPSAAHPDAPRDRAPVAAGANGDGHDAGERPPLAQSSP
jgi:peptidoglycan/xylan/chitin deacetylase (PgdA/CDA1 family)